MIDSSLANLEPRPTADEIVVMQNTPTGNSSISVGRLH